MKKLTLILTICCALIGTAHAVDYVEVFNEDFSSFDSGQFTLYGDTRKGRRPSFIEAAGAEKGENLYNVFNKNLQNYGINVAEGVFGAMMDVELINDGPVTIIIESKF